MAAIIAMIAYGSLYPFAFHAVPDGIGPFRTLLGNWNDTPGRGDFLSNILLYMPLGFIGALSVGKRAGPKQLFTTILIGAALSFTIESTQYYDYGRDPQATDFYANTLGTVIGACAGWFFGQDFRWPLVADISANRAPALLLSAWLGYRLYPYVPTIDLHKYWSALKPVFLYPEITLNALFRHAAIWLAICVMIEKIVGGERAGGLIRRFVAFLLFSCVLVISTTVTLSQILGIALAFGIWQALPTSRVRVLAAAAAMGAYVVVFRLDPFVFSPAPGHYSWTPFLSFMQGSIDIDVRSFFEKVFLYGGLIWLLGEAGMAVRLSTVIVAGIVFAASIAEVFIPGRSAEITDAILALAVGEFIRVLDRRASVRVRYGTIFRSAPAQADTLTRRLTLIDDIDEFIAPAE